MPQNQRLTHCVCLLLVVIFFQNVSAQTVTPLWERALGTQVAGTDQGKAITGDASGNVYVLGEIKVNSPTGTEILLEKFDPQGNLLWDQVYHNAFQVSDIAVDVDIDGMGNVYALINSPTVAGLQRDLVVLKYDATGTLLTTLSYNNPFGGEEQGFELHVSPGGVITALAQGPLLAGNTILVVRWDAAGALIYDQNWTAPGAADHVPQDLVVDDQGNAYIATSPDYPAPSFPAVPTALFQLDGGGNVVWDTILGPFQMNNFLYLTELYLNPDGSLYLLGMEDGFNPRAKLWKFDTSGNFLGDALSPAFGFTQVEAMGITMGLDSNLYVAYQGRQNGNISNWIWKLDSDLGFFWHRSFDNTFDLPPGFRNPLATAPNGNLVIAGVEEYSASLNSFTANMRVLELDTAVVLQQNFTYNGPADGRDQPADFYLDETGQAWLTGIAMPERPNRDISTVRVDLGVGTLQEHFRGDLVPGNDRAKVVRTDLQGNVYVGGNTEGPGINPGALLAKYDPAGNLLWDTIFYPPNAESFVLVDMEVDANGTMYVVGHGDYSQGRSLVQFRFLTNAQLGPSGVHFPIGGEEYVAVDIALDPLGGFYIGANFVVNANQTDWYVVKYNVSGTPDWFLTIPDSVANGTGIGNLDKLVPQGSDVLVGGLMGNTPTAYRFDVNGNKLNTYLAVGQTFQTDLQFDADPQGNVVFHGSTFDAVNGGLDWWTTVLSPTGTVLHDWRFRDNGPDQADPTALAVDNAGHIYAGGISRAHTSSVVRYNLNGNRDWEVQTAQSSVFTRVEVASILPTPGGGAIAIGLDGQTPPKMQVSNIAAAGFQNWSYTYADPGAGVDLTHGLGGELLAAGYATTSTEWWEAIIVKFDQATGLAEPITESLLVYPQPAEGQLTLEGEALETQNWTRADLIDLTGRVIRQITLDPIATAHGKLKLNYRGVSPGIYLLNLQSQAGQQLSQKIILK